MRTIRTWFPAVLVLIIPLIAWSQIENSTAPTGFSDYLRSEGSYGLGLKTLGFLDPSRMTFSHSYSMSYVSSGNQSLAQGLFMETIGYRLSKPLTLTLNLGYLHQPYSSYDPGGGGFFSSDAFVGGAALTWRPRNNMLLRIEVANFPSYPGYGYYPNGWMRPGYSPIDPNYPIQPNNLSNPGTASDWE